MTTTGYGGIKGTRSNTIWVKIPSDLLEMYCERLLDDIRKRLQIRNRNKRKIRYEKE